jgi:DNA-binding FrmR family transcriptional regulator
MLPEQKRKSLAALKRLNGLSKKVESMIMSNQYCTHILENLLAMQGHIKGIQAEVLHSHLHTCAKMQIASPKKYETFIQELLKTIGLSRRP